MAATRHYVLASLALGAIAVWASESAFWFVPHDPPGPLEWVLTWLLYATAAAAGLSAALWSGCGGWAAAFLGGSIMGYAVEGMVLSTTYDAFPVQLAWTPLAWHGLLSGGVVLALSRVAMAPGRRAALWIVAGLGLAAWGQYWGATHDDPLTGAGLWLYLLGSAVPAVAAGLALDRLGPLPMPPRAVLLAAPALLALSWAAQSVLLLDPRRLALLPILALILWVLRRLGGSPGSLDLRGPRRGAEHFLLLLAPLAALTAAPALRASGLDLSGANIAVAVATVLASLLALGALAVRALRRGPSRGSPAGAGP